MYMNPTNKNAKWTPKVQNISKTVNIFVKF